MLFDVPELAICRHLIGKARERLAAGGGEGGYSTETVVITALLVAAAVFAIGFIAKKIVETAEAIQFK